jgi:L-alanine-DL-glutamate epimerase-like enolase superfamily enzyme
MLRIQNVELCTATIPRKSAFEIARGTFVAAHRTFVRVTLEDGSIGYGECGTLEGKGDRGSVAVYAEETQQSSHAVLAQQIGPVVIGMDATNIADVHRAIAEVTLMNPQASRFECLSTCFSEGRIAARLPWRSPWACAPTKSAWIPRNASSTTAFMSSS